MRPPDAFKDTLSAPCLNFLILMAPTRQVKRIPVIYVQGLSLSLGKNDKLAIQVVSYPHPFEAGETSVGVNEFAIQTGKTVFFFHGFIIGIFRFQCQDIYSLGMTIFGIRIACKERT